MNVLRTFARSLARFFFFFGKGASDDVFPHETYTGDTDLADRERLIRRILSTIHNNSILLSGGPGSGKTDLLLYLRGHLSDLDDPATKFFPVYIDLRGVQEYLLFATVADAVLGQLGFAAPTKAERVGSDYSHRELANDFRGVIETLRESSSKKARLVLLVDGIDQLNNYQPRTTQRVRSLFMASLAESLVMVASAVEIDKHWEEEGSPWYNFFEEIQFSPTRRDSGSPG